MVLLLWIIYVISALLCYAFMRACLLMPCGHLLGKGWPLGSRLWCLNCEVVTFPLVSWVRSVAWLYWFLIFVLFLTLYTCMLKAYMLALCLRKRSAPVVNCWVIIHCLEVNCKEDQITSVQREWFIFAQLTDKQWIITQQLTHWSWSISILTHNKRRKHIRSLQLLPTFRHCTEELAPKLRLRRICLYVIVTSFKRKNDVTPSSAINVVIFQWRQLSHTLAVNYCPIYHSLLPLAL